MNPIDADSNKPAATILSQPDLLLVAAVREADAQAAMLLLESGGLPHSEHLVSGFDQATALVSQSSVGDLDQLTDWMRMNPSGHLLMVAPDPITEVATALSCGVRPAEALESWAAMATQAKALMSAIGCRRGSVLMTDALYSNPQASLRSLAERLGLALVHRLDNDGTANVDGRSHTRTASEPCAIFKIMAENALRQAPSMRAQLTELLAFALPIASDESTSWDVVEEAFNDYQKILSESPKALQAQLIKKARLTERLGVQKKQSTERKKVIEQFEVDRAEKDAEWPDTRYQDLQEENDLLLKQLHHVQEELERHYLKQVDFAGSELAEAKAKIEALLSSMSWKITRPLRIIFGVLTGNKTDL